MLRRCKKQVAFAFSPDNDQGLAWCRPVLLFFAAAAGFLLLAPPVAYLLSLVGGGSHCFWQFCPCYAAQNASAWYRHCLGAGAQTVLLVAAGLLVIGAALSHYWAALEICAACKSEDEIDASEAEYALLVARERRGGLWRRLRFAFSDQNEDRLLVWEPPSHNAVWLSVYFVALVVATVFGVGFAVLPLFAPLAHVFRFDVICSAVGGECLLNVTNCTWVNYNGGGCVTQGFFTLLIAFLLPLFLLLLFGLLYEFVRCCCCGVIRSPDEIDAFYAQRTANDADAGGGGDDDDDDSEENESEEDEGAKEE